MDEEGGKGKEEGRRHKGIKERKMTHSALRMFIVPVVHLLNDNFAKIALVHNFEVGNRLS